MTSEPEQDGGGLQSQAMLTVAAVARRLGVAPSTLRTWDRRYGLGPSAHTAGSHRRYSPADVGRLVVMRGLVMEGVPPAEAAQIALGAGVDDPPVAAPPDPPPGAGPGPRSDRGISGGRGTAGWAGPSSMAGVPASRPMPRSGLPLPSTPGSPPVTGPGSATPGPATPGTDPAPDGSGLPDGAGRAVWPVAPLAARHLFPALLQPSDPLMQPRSGGSSSYPGSYPGAFGGGPEHDRAHDGDDVADGGLGDVLAQVIDEAMDRRSRPPAPYGQVGPEREWPAPAWPVVGASRAGGGRVISLPDASPRARGLARAAMSLDTHELTRLLRDAVGAYGVIGAWNTMVLPVLKGMGDRWEATGEGVDVEHAFAEATMSVLRGVAGTLYRPRNVRPVLLACSDGDYHSLPLHVLAAALAEVEVGCRLLGVGLPAGALASATRRTGPAAVFVYARLAVTDASGLRDFSRQRPAPRILVGGPGWQHAELPPGVVHVDSLSLAVDAVLDAVQLG